MLGNTNKASKLKPQLIIMLNPSLTLHKIIIKISTSPNNSKDPSREDIVIQGTQVLETEVLEEVQKFKQVETRDRSF
jgi:hypothetical protein